MDDLQKLRRSLMSIGNAPVGREAVLALAHVWRDESKRAAPFDTGQLEGRIAVTQAGDKEATIVADTPYAGYVEYGTRYHPTPNPFFRTGRDAAKKAADDMGLPLETEISRVLTSGGVFNPRRVRWTRLQSL